MRGIGIGLLLIGISGIAAGQYVYGVSAIGVRPNPNGVESLSATWADYDILQYYDVIADGFLYDWTTVVASDSAVDSYGAYLFLNTSWSVNKVYTLQTNHWVRAYYYTVVNSTITYEDYFGFSLLGNGGNTTGSGTYSPPGQYVTTYSQDYYVGTTWIQDSTLEPVITDIDVFGSQVPGASGYIDVYGSDLVKPFNFDYYYPGYYQELPQPSVETASVCTSTGRTGTILG